MWTLWLGLFGCSGLAVLLTTTTRRVEAVDKSDLFLAFQTNCSFVFFLVASAEWLQLTNLGALYAHYEVDAARAVGLYTTSLYVAAVACPALGACCDTFGRKQMSLAYFGLRLASAALKFSSAETPLWLSHVLAGLSFACLVASFEVCRTPSAPRPRPRATPTHPRRPAPTAPLVLARPSFAPAGRRVAADARLVSRLTWRARCPSTTGVAGVRAPEAGLLGSAAGEHVRGALLG